MNPLIQSILKDKIRRRSRLMVLPYPEKVRMVQWMRAEALQIHAVVRRELKQAKEEQP